jgi:hypothetical protein
MPPAWKDLLEALEILAKYPSNFTSPLHCEHDHLTVMADPDQFTDDELIRLERLGFFPKRDEGVFCSFRFGSA